MSSPPHPEVAQAMGQAKRRDRPSVLDLSNPNAAEPDTLPGPSHTAMRARTFPPFTLPATHDFIYSQPYTSPSLMTQTQSLNTQTRPLALLLQVPPWIPIISPSTRLRSLQSLPFLHYTLFPRLQTYVTINPILSLLPEILLQSTDEALSGLASWRHLDGRVLPERMMMMLYLLGRNLSKRRRKTLKWTLQTALGPSRQSMVTVTVMKIMIM